MASDELITQLRELPQAALASGDVLPIVDISASQTKKIKASSLIAGGINLIPSGTLDLALLDQTSATKLTGNALSSGIITASKMAASSTTAVAGAAPSGDNFTGRGFFNSSTGNLQVWDGAAFAQVVLPSGGIGDGQVVAAKIASGSIDTTKIVASGLTSAAYASGSVVTAALADGAVTGAKIASGTITPGLIASGTLTGAQLAGGTIAYANIQPTASGDVVLGATTSGTITEITCTSVGRAVIGAADTAAQRTALGLGNISQANGAWVDGSSVDGTCTGTNTGDQTITLTGDVEGSGANTFATTITANAITEVKLADDAVTANKLADGAVDADKFADNSSVIVATSVPIGNGAFVGQQWVNENTGWEYTWTGSQWLRLQSVADITFDNSSPLTFSATLTDPFTAEITVGQTIQPAGQVLAGPVSGGDAAPAYRALTASDLPLATSGTPGIVQPGTGLAVSEGIINHSNTVASGTINGFSFDGQGHITAAVALAASDIPSLDAGKITTGEFSTERYADDSVTASKLADYATAQIGEVLPTADYTGQIFFNPLAKSFFLWDGNVWQPIGISVGGIEFAGTYDASGNTVLSTTAKGTAAGLVVGSGLPAAGEATKNYYVVVASGGTGTAPAPTVTLAPPDLILSDGSAWLEIDVSTGFSSQSAAQVSFNPAGQVSASNVQAAIEEVSSECRDASNIASGVLAVARGGTNIASYTKGDFIVASGATVLSKLGVGTNGQTLVADSTADLGVRWGTVSGVGTVTNVSSTTAALVVASGTSGTTPSLSIASASTTASGIVMLTNSTSTTSSALAATATAVKTVADVANGALQASGSTVTGQLRIGTTGSLVFEGSVDDANKTTLAVANPTAARTITLPNETGTVITSAGSGVVTSTMIADGTIVNADINANAAIALTKLGTGALPSGITVASVNIVDGTIVNADINATAAIAGSKIAPDFAANVRVGQTSSDTPGAGNNVYGASVRTSGNGYFSADDAIAGLFNRSNDGALVSMRRGGTQVGSISVTASATAYNTSSDYRLKENIVPLDGAIDRLSRLPVHRFNFISDPSATVDGFLAHEAAEVVPEAVIGAKDAVDDDGAPVYQQIDLSKLVPLLTAALQDAVERIEDLGAKVDALEQLIR